MKQYIDKTTVVAEIKSRIKEYDKFADAAADNNLHNTLEACELLIRHYTSLLSFLDTLEVKEVDLEKELEVLDNLLYDLDGVAVKGATSYLTVENVKDIAKHFFELGLMVKK